MDNVLSAIPATARTVPAARERGDCGKKRIELSRGPPARAMGIASVSPPGGVGKLVGGTLFGAAAMAIDKAGPPLAGLNRRIASVAAVSTTVQDDRDTSAPVAWSKAAAASLPRAR